MPSPRSNRNFILGFAVIAAISLTFGIVNFHKAIPEIGINFRVSRSQALQNAREFLTSRHYDLTGYHQTISFSYEGDAKIYLERELGVERMTSLADSLDIWRWRARFFKPLQKLEYIVSVDPNGRMTGFKRELDEATPGPSLDSTAARALAEAFITGPMGDDLARWDLVESSFIDRPARRDHSITYELKNFRAKDAPYRMTVELQGAEVSRCKRFLRVPEDWWREWERQRAQNELFDKIASAAALLMAIGIVYHFFKNVKGGQVPWRTGIILGVVLGGVNVVMVLNSTPLELAYSYETTASYAAFLAQIILTSLSYGLVLGLLLVLLFGAGERLYRQDHPGKMFLPALFTKRGIRSKEFFQATVMGYLLCAFDVGFVVLVYVLGKKIGFWSPADIKYSEAVSTALPWIYPLALSMGAALLEEFYFRLFGISFFKRLTKSTVLAVVIPAFIWGFLHSSSPQQPGFARGIEVGLVGIIAGVLMLRFGIWTMLVYHYLFDAVMFGLFLFRSQNVYFWVSGLIVCGALLAPAIVTGVIYLRRRRFEPVDDQLNAAVAVPPTRRKVSEEQPEFIPVAAGLPAATPAGRDALTPLKRRWALIVGVVGILLALIPGPRKFGDEFKLTISSDEAVRIARAAVVERHNIAPDSFLVGVETSPTSERDEAVTYTKKFGTLSQAEKLLLSPEGAQTNIWRVRLKRQFDPTEYTCVVPMDGSPPRVNKMIADSAAGADFPVDTARAIAEQRFLQQTANPSRFHLIEEKSTKRPHRRDWNFVWETTTPVLAEAHLRRSVSLTGDETYVSDSWIKVPEEWERHEKELRVGSIILGGFSLFAVMGIGVWMLIALGKGIKRGRVFWRGGLIGAAVVLAAVVADALLKLPTLWMLYDTSKPAASYLTQWWITHLFKAIAFPGAVLIAVALAESLASAVNGFRISLVGGSGGRGWMSGDSHTTLALVGAVVGLSWLQGATTAWLGLPEHNWDYLLPRQLNLSLPWLGVWTSAVISGILFGTLLVALFLLMENAAKKWWHKGLVLVAVSLIALNVASTNAGNWSAAELVWGWMQGAVLVGGIYAVLRIWGGWRLPAVVVALVILRLVWAGAELARLDGSPYQVQGWFLLVCALAALGVLFLRGRNMVIK